MGLKQSDLQGQGAPDLRPELLSLAGGVESRRLSSTGGFPLTVVVSGSRASSSFNASKLFLFSRVASVE
jgi:hypothetical protein